MPFTGKRKAPSEMTQRELVGTLVAFTVIVAMIDTIVGIDCARHGFSVLNAIIWVFTLVCLGSAYRLLLGELLLRRRARQTPPNDSEA